MPTEIPESQTVAKGPQSGAQIDAKLDAEYGFDVSKVLEDNRHIEILHTTTGAVTNWAAGNPVDQGSGAYGKVLVLTMDQATQLTEGGGAAEGQDMVLRVVQDGIGGHALTFSSAYKMGATPPVPSVAAGSVDVYSFKRGSGGTMWLTGFVKGS